MISKIKISYRLFLGFALVISMLVLVTVIGIHKVDVINSKLTEINDINSVKQRYAINFRGSVHDRAIAIRDVVLHHDINKVNNSIADIRKLESFYKASAQPMAQMMARHSDAQERAMLSAIEDIEQETLPVVDAIISLRLKGDIEAARTRLLQHAGEGFVKWLGCHQCIH